MKNRSCKLRLAGTDMNKWSKVIKIYENKLSKLKKNERDIQSALDKIDNKIKE